MSVQRTAPLAPASARPKSNATTSSAPRPAPIDPNKDVEYPIYVSIFLKPSELDVRMFVLLSVMMAYVAGVCALIWYGDTGEIEWADGSDHFGITHSFKPGLSEVGRQIGSLFGYLFDAVRAGILWTIISVWWLNAACMGLFIIYHLIARQIMNIWKGINYFCNHEELGVIPRLGLHALFHSILALLFHYTLWTRTIPYPTLWGWINFIKLDFLVLQYVVLGSIALSFVLGGCNLTLVELVMLPITIPIRIVRHGERMEMERYERERDSSRNVAGGGDESKV